MSRETFDSRAADIKKTLSATKGELPKTAENGLLSAASIKSNLLLDMKEAVRYVDALRNGGANNAPIDISLAEFAKEKFGFGSVDTFLHAVGINPSKDTIDSFMTSPEFTEGYRWLVPEVIREAVRLGLRRNPIYPNLIADEVSVSQKKVTLPHINMSDATPEVVNENETIPVGTVSFGEKDVKLRKIGTGLKISDDVQKYVPLNILSLYLQDAGVKLGLGLDTMAIDVLVNGDDNTGQFSAPVIGVKDIAQGITYFDLLRLWIRMGRLGRMPAGMISNEEAALKIMQFAEFKGANYNNTKQNINLRTPVPQSQEYLIHGAMPNSEKIGFYDNSAALLKLNAEALKVESERIAERQLTGTYVTVVTGFAKLYRDAFVILDATQAFSATGFPTWMDVAAAESVLIK